MVLMNFSKQDRVELLKNKFGFHSTQNANQLVYGTLFYPCGPTLHHYVHVIFGEFW